MSNTKLKSLGKNYLGENILFNENDTNKIYDKITNVLMSEIYNKQLSVSNGREFLNKIYKLYDEGNEQFEKYASCSKSCSDCCCLYVECTAIEAELIRDYVQANFPKDDKEVFMNKVKELLPTIPSPYEIKENIKIAHNYLSKKIPCVFLSDEKTCMIYPVRPFNCRKFLSISSPEKCDIGGKVNKISPSINNIGTLSINVLSLSVTRFKNLKYDSNKDFDALHKSIPLWFKDGFSEINRLK
ncbi:YkgJ family cysteine cluster protein [Clostridium cochlearium]|uniref:YkgJ family cysteine cluster protein n=1 Tax=Clostridium cochlearium TaxID=1494 RepID=UPI000BBC3FB7|nr:YkgJ family cysteine cluster protein [Clostridium cochlearium]